MLRFVLRLKRGVRNFLLTFGRVCLRVPLLTGMRNRSA
jgi:hypothetical protein